MALQVARRAQVLDDRVLALIECLQLVLELVRGGCHLVLDAADRHALAVLRVMQQVL